MKIFNLVLVYLITLAIGYTMLAKASSADPVKKTPPKATGNIHLTVRKAGKTQQEYMTSNPGRISPAGQSLSTQKLKAK